MTLSTSPVSPDAAMLAAESAVRFAVTDIDGVFRGKTLSGGKAATMLGGGTICSAVFGWDINDALYDNASFTGWHTGYPDIGLVLDPATARRLPWDHDQWLILGEHVSADGSPLPICPRQVLKRVVAQAAALGFTAQVGVEFEWTVFAETERSVRDKGFRNLATATQAINNYSPFRLDAVKAFAHDLFVMLPQVDVPIEVLHTEAGPGNLEAAIRYGDALQAADRAILFKQATREIGRSHGLLNSYMAKPSTTWSGCGQHLHQSLWKDGANVFHDASAPEDISATMRHFIAGQLHCLPHLFPLYAPFVNSYKRLVDHFLAPVKPTWAIDNRNASLRVIPGSPNSMRLETRTPGADANPYLAIAAALASGLYGIENRLPLTLDPVTGYNAGAEGVARLPRTLIEATDAMDASPVARGLFGDAFVRHIVETRRWEWRKFCEVVTDWEVERYLDIV